MASVNEPGVIRIYAQTPSGQRIKTHEYRSDSFINCGKSPDGVLANLTVDKQPFIPKSNVVLYGGFTVVMTFEPDSTDGIDVSDCVVSLPLTTPTGVIYLNTTTLGITTDLTPIADREMDLGSGYEIPQGTRAKIGGGTGVISIEDDTA